MHQYVILPIGTKIHNKLHGDGLIIGNAHLRNNIYRRRNSDPPMLVYYMTYFPDIKLRRYLTTRAFEVTAPMDTNSQAIALSYLIDAVNPTKNLMHAAPTGEANYYFGDWITTELFGHGIILSDGFYQPGKSKESIYHHVYFPNAAVFEFEREHYQTIVKLADKKSVQYAKSVIQNQILIPAFA